MDNKTCGECRFLESAKKIGVCDKMNFCLCPSELPSCSKFEQKVVTNGDVIRQMSNDELATWGMYDLGTCPTFEKQQSCSKRGECSASEVEDCWLAWLNAPTESQFYDAIQNVIKDGAKTAIDIHEAAYAPDMNDGTIAVCVKPNGNHDTQTDLCKVDNTESEVKR